MTSSSNLRLGSARIHKLFEAINQEFKAQGTKFQLLPNFGICCRELEGLKVVSFHACVCSFYSVSKASVSDQSDLDAVQSFKQLQF